MGKHSLPEEQEQELPTPRNPEVEAAEAESNQYLLTCARNRLHGPVNAHYAKGIYDLIADFLGYDENRIPGLLKASKDLDAEGLDWWLRQTQDGRR